jgi:hypothetical protein
MFDAVSQVLTRPAAFFRTLKDDDRVVSRAIFVVLSAALLSAVAAYFAALPMADATQGTPLALFFNPFFSALISLATFFVLWLITGLLVRMGAGMEAKPWAVTGYALVPQLLIAAVLIIVNALFPVQLSPVSASLDLSDVAAVQAATESVTTELQASAANRVTTVLSYLSSLWLLVLTFIGVRETAGRPKAVRATIIVGVVTLLFIVGPLLLR